MIKIKEISIRTHSGLEMAIWEVLVLQGGFLFQYTLRSWAGQGYFGHFWKKIKFSEWLIS